MRKGRWCWTSFLFCIPRRLSPPGPSLGWVPSRQGAVGRWVNLDQKWGRCPVCATWSSCVKCWKQAVIRAGRLRTCASGRANMDGYGWDFCGNGRVLISPSTVLECAKQASQDCTTRNPTTTRDGGLEAWACTRRLELGAWKTPIPCRDRFVPTKAAEAILSRFSRRWDLVANGHEQEALTLYRCSRHPQLLSKGRPPE